MKQSLNFSWSFLKGYQDSYLKKLPSDKVEVVDIPHNAVNIPYNYFSELVYQDIFTYEKKFDVLDYHEEQRYILKFDGFMFKAKIYLNNNFLGEFISGYLPIEIDVSEFIKNKNNRLLVVLDSKEDINYPPFGFALDYITFSGIYREVWLESHLSTFLANVYVHGDDQGHVRVIYDINGDDEISVTHSIYLGDKFIGKSNEDHFKVDNPILYDLTNPVLYTLISEVTVNGKKELYENKFAFKSAVFKEDGFYLNGKKIKLRGLNRHQGYPYIGYAASKSLQEEDAVLLKETGLNVVRTSHYPQSESFLAKCDEIGLLVVDEIPGWQHIGESNIWKEACISNTRRMVLKERNHPSIIAYGVRIDESVDDHELYTKTNEIAHVLDPYRQTIGVRNFAKSELLEDIYGYNDFICDSLDVGVAKPQKISKDKKPYLITEYMGHMDPLKATSDIDKAIEVALRHYRVIDDAYKYDKISGSIGWCFVDYHSHTDFGSGDHICPHGVYDLYRNPKLSSYVYSSQQENKPVLELLSNFKPGDVKEAIFNDLWVATNCDYIELYKDDELVNKFYPNNKVFKYLKHPPILIDDIVGYTFKEDKFPKKMQIKIARMFSYAAMRGFNHLPLKISLCLGWIMMRYKVTYSELVHYWNKYVGSWGGKAKIYKIKGYINNVEVISKEVGPSDVTHFDVTLSKDILKNEDTYDTLTVRIKHLDSHNSLCRYSSRIVNISTEGPIRLLGESNQVLLGGQLSIYIASKNETGLGKIILKIDDETIEKEIEVI